MPTIGRKTAADVASFSELTEVMDEASRAIGWVIRMRKVLADGGISEIQNLLPCVQQRLPGTDLRLALGHACLLFFTKKVCL